MLIKTLLNKVEKFKLFVYKSVKFDSVMGTGKGTDDHNI